MKRIYHTWDRWECYPAGFYEIKPPDKSMSDDYCRDLYAEFLRDIPTFEAAMEGVMLNWPRSCEHYLTHERMNRIAWLGQAAMCFELGVPAYFCGGFQRLTPEEQNAANQAARRYLDRWLTQHGYPPSNGNDLGEKIE